MKGRPSKRPRCQVCEETLFRTPLGWICLNGHGIRPLEAARNRLGWKLPTTAGGWGTIFADPPWLFDDRGSRATPGYEMVGAAGILAMPVRLIRAPLSHLYLWTTDSHLQLAFQVIRLWGFEYKHQIIWRKVSNAGHLQIGMGHYWRKCHEVCLFATAGAAKARRHDLPSVFDAPRTVHSRKPEILQDLAETMSPEPRLELFARRHRPGWRCWGDALPEPAGAETT